ncbi:MAG: TIGR04002 family protein [Clostridia bacterium]|nr:TIGR04002 family protein [Clostridia bacterium]
MKNKKRLKFMVLASLFAAVIAVFIAWFFHIPIKIGANSAYLHFGDVFIFLAASLLPTPYAAAAAGIGGGLGDLFCGGAEWIPFTVIIKILVSLCFTAKKDKLLNKQNIVAPITALVFTVGGYYVAEALIFGNWISPLISVWGNVVQILGSAALYYPIAAALEKFGIKKLIQNED